MRSQIIGALCALILLAATVHAKNENVTDVITDPFEDDFDLRFAADTFCQKYTEAKPGGKIAIPYKPNCHFWWQCTAYELRKHECQGLASRITLHYDLYLDRCESPESVKCNYLYDEEEIIMEEIMKYYRKQPPATTPDPK